MALQRMDHVGVVVDDLQAAIAFFVELGMDLVGEAPVEERWVDRSSRSTTYASTSHSCAPRMGTASSS